MKRNLKKTNYHDSDYWISMYCVFAVMFMQFKTIEETDITAIENMRETELRAAISEWKGKYEETQALLEETKIYSRISR